MTRAVPVPQMLTARTVAQRLGKSRGWVYAACEVGTFPGAYRDGSYWKIPADDVLAWIETQRRATRAA